MNLFKRYPTAFIEVDNLAEYIKEVDPIDWLYIGNTDYGRKFLVEEVRFNKWKNKKDFYYTEVTELYPSLID